MVGSARRAAALAVLAALAGACRPSILPPVSSGSSTVDGPTDTAPGTDSDTDTDTDTTGEDSGGDTTDTTPPGLVFDCDTIPTMPTGTRELPGARGYHDVVFDDVGNIIGQSPSGDLLKVDYSGNIQVFVPGAGTTQQMVWLPDGDLAVASDSYGIVRVDAASGSTTVINPDIHPYGLILGPDGMLWSANQQVVHRVDPIDGASEIIVRNGDIARGSPRVINFNLDYTKLYIGTLSGSQGRIYVVDLDANYDPAGPVVEFADGVGSGSYHDTLGVDICGYLYISDYSTFSMYRVSSSGLVQKILDSGFLGGDYGHGADWGSGIGGFLDDALYISRPYGNNKVSEVLVGVPSREWKLGTAINIP